MTFIETTSFFMRVMKFDFSCRKKEVNLQFRLIPMFHIASKEYYNEVVQLVNECDELIYEGADVQQIKRLTNQYKKVANKLNLVTQSKSIKKEHIKGNLISIHGDYNKETGQKAWQNMCFIERLKLRYIKPIRFYFLSKIITRKQLANQYLHSAIKTRLAYPENEEKGTSKHFIMKTRDDIVINIMRSFQMIK